MATCAVVGCSKSINVMAFSCRCGDVFCSKHRLPPEHRCTFDFKTMERKRLEEANPKVVSDKVEQV